MKILIRQATIVDPASPHNGKRMDLFIQNGKISEIKKKISVSGNYEEITSPQLHVSPGWLDIGAQLGEPGFEHRETLESGAAAAARGGFTSVACFPNTAPTLHSKSEISYILRQTRDLPVSIYPAGAISRDCGGIELAELLDMHAVGAIAFSDGEHAVNNSGLLLRAMQYVKRIDGLIIQSAFDRTIIPDGLMHEGKFSTKIGLRGIPVLAETLMIRRDLRLLEYTGSKLHLHGISAGESVNIARDAKHNKLNISCSVPALNLLLEDDILEGFDERYKVLPPLRSDYDRKNLIAGLMDGTIDCIVSNHVPRDSEEKHRELALSAFGSIGLETAYAIANTALAGQMDTASIVEKFCQHPRKLLGLPIGMLQAGEVADLTIFDPEMEWTVNASESRSLSRNEGVDGYKLKGKVLGIVSKGKSLLHNNR